MDSPTPAPGGKPSAAARTFGRVLAGLGGLGVLACLFLPLLAVMSPKKYRASVLMEVQVTPLLLKSYDPTTNSALPLNKKSPTDHLMSGETKIAMSKDVLLKVIHKLNLTERWKTATDDDTAENFGTWPVPPAGAAPILCASPSPP